MRARRCGGLSPEYLEFERRLTRLIRRAIKWSARSAAGPPERQLARNRFEELALKIIDRDYSDPDAKRISARIWRHDHGIFSFVTEPGVEPTNNWAETNIRAAVVMRKNSYGNQSVQGARTQGVLMSVFRSMELQGLQVIPHTLELVGAEIRVRHNFKKHSIAAGA